MRDHPSLPPETDAEGRGKAFLPADRHHEVTTHLEGDHRFEHQGGCTRVAHREDDQAEDATHGEGQAGMN